MQNTDNFDLKIYEGEDLFNPLVVENANAQAIDTQMKKNENHTVGDATELVSGTVHALTRLTPDTPMLRFTATSRFTAGDTFTVDGVQVSALTVSGEQLPDGAYIIGSEVLAYLKGTLLTFFTSQGTLATAQNALKLGGNTPEYYATATAVQQAQDTATAAGNLANEVNSNLATIGNSLCVPTSANYTLHSHTLVSSGNFQSGTFTMNTTQNITQNSEAFKFVTPNGNEAFIPKIANGFMIDGATQKVYPLVLGANGVMIPFLGMTIPSGNYMCYYNIMRN